MTFNFGGSANTGQGAKPTFSFGSTGQQTAQTPTFSFGGSGAPSTPKPSTTFSFGSPSIQPTTPTLFQGQSGTGFGFGANTPTNNSMFSTPQTLFGSQVITPQVNNAMGPTQHIAYIMAQYDPASDACKFRHILYNRVEKDQISQYSRPPTIHPQLWHQAESANPDPSRLVPAQAVGFPDLLKRMDEQDKVTKLQAQQMENIKKFLQSIQNNHDLDTRIRIEQNKRRHLELSHKMIRVVKKLEILKNHGLAITPAEEQLRSRLENYRRELDRPTHFKGRLNELQAQVRLQEDRQSHQKYPSLSEEEAEQIYQYLSQQTEGISQLSAYLKKVKQNLGVLKEELEGLRK